MKLICAFALLLAASFNPNAQNLINQYQNDLTAASFNSYITQGTIYAGEFQVFLDNLYQEYPFAVSLDEADQIWYEVESVSFPFQIPEFTETNAFSRWMTLPLESTKQITPSAFNDLIFDMSYHLDLSGSAEKIYTNLTREITTNNQVSQFSTQPSSLISAKFSNASASSYYLNNQDRLLLPHGILKFTFHLMCENVEFFSFSLLTDLTRGQFRYYPFCNNFEAGSSAELYDLQIRPRFKIVSPLGYQYSTNNTTYPTDGSGTINYFNWINEDHSEVPEICREIAYPVDPENSVSSYLVPPPYSLLDAPVLNSDGSYYAGYNLNHIPWSLAELSTYTLPIAWQFFIDRTFDISTINPDERVVYLPEECHIGKPVYSTNQLPLAYNGVEITFPTGYTFKTIYGEFPSRNQYNAELASGYANRYSDCHPPSDVPASVLYVENGSVLNIDGCVRIMDCSVHVMAGGTLNYNSDLVVGNYTVVNNGGIINDESAVNNQFIVCASACSIPGNYDYPILNVDPNNPVTITGSTSVLGSITVEDGGILTLVSNAILYMGPDAKIIVKNGGKLIASNATITSACDKMWRGIEVWSLPVSGIEIPGEIHLSNSIIRNAHIGMLAAKSKLPDANGTSIDSDGIFNFNSDGGIVDVQDTRFEDCGIGIYMPRGFHSFVPPDATDCIIEGNTFTTGSVGLLDQRYNNARSDAYPDPHVPWFGHANSECRMTNGVLISQIKDIVVGGAATGAGNHFINVEVGVRQYGTHCDVINNDFKNVQYGVYMNSSSHYWNIETRTKISGNTFLDVFDPNPSEISELPFPNAQYVNNVSLVGIADKGNTSCARVESMNMLEISGNFFGDNLFSGGIVNGIYLENVAGLLVKSNQFYANKRGIICWDSDGHDIDQALIGADNAVTDVNVFKNCETSFLSGGENISLLFRCNFLENLPSYQKNFVSRGLLGDQGYIPDSGILDDHSAAGNRFVDSYNKIYSLGDEDLISEYNIALEEEFTQPDYYTGWSYFHHLDEEYIPSVVYAPQTSFYEVTLGSINQYFNPATSCISPYRLAQVVSNENVYVSDLTSVTALWQQAKLLHATKLQEQDAFNTATSILLNAIYGGISDQAELQLFLKNNSPLSTTVMEAYMRKENLPYTYLHEIIALNGSLDQSLHALAEEKTMDMPATIAYSIQQLLLNNPFVTSASEIGRRVKAYDLARQSALQDSLSVLIRGNQMNDAKNLIDDEPELRKKMLNFKMKIMSSDEAAANAAVLEIPAMTPKIQQWAADAKILLGWLGASNPYGRYTQPATDALIGKLEPNPADENYTNNKYFYGEQGVFPMYIPKEAPEDRSMRRKVKDTVVFTPKVYPNPASDYLRIEYPMAEKDQAYFVLSDMMGKIVLQETFNAHLQPALISLRHLLPGMFAWLIVCQEQTTSGKLEIR